MSTARTVGSLAAQFYSTSADGASGRSVVPLLALTGTLALALAGCSEPKADPVPDVRPVRAERVSYGAQTERMTLAATIQPRFETPAGFRVAGKVIERRVDVGQMVKAGAVLARLDPADLALQLRATEAQLRAAEADLVRARADLVRSVQLSGTPAYNKSLHDQRLAGERAALERVRQFQDQTRLARNQLDYAELTAPADGVVTALSMEAGQVVAAGQTVLTLARTDALDIVVSLPESRLYAAQAADRARMVLWTAPDRPVAVKLREVAPGADPTTRTYRARFTLPDDAPAVEIGMSATLILERAGDARVARLPLTAIFQEKGGQAVWVVDPQSGRLTLKPVEIASYGQQAALILSGVADGEMVVTAGVHKLDAKQRVRLLGAPQAQLSQPQLSQGAASKP